jgi:hypothetical protein
MAMMPRPGQVAPVAAAAMLLLAAALLATAPWGCGPGTQAPPPVKANTPEEFLKGYGLKGQVALVQFGIVGCALSEAGLNEMMRLQKGGAITGLAYARVDTSEDQKAADEYLAARKPGFIVHRDPQSVLAKAFGATAWPTYLLVDKFGHVRYRGSWPENAKLGEWTAALATEPSDPGPSAPMFTATVLDTKKLLDETKLPDLKGAAKPLRDYMGRGGLLAFFADTTCPFSAAAVAELKVVTDTLAKHAVPGVIINLGDKKAAIENLYAARDLGAAVIYDETKATQKAWDVHSVPTVVLMTPDGIVAYRGPAVWKDLGDAAEATLKLPAGTLKFAVKGTEFG